MTASRQYVAAGLISAVSNETGVRQYVTVRGVSIEETPTTVAITGQAMTSGRGTVVSAVRFSPVGAVMTSGRGSPVSGIRVAVLGQASTVSRGAVVAVVGIGITGRSVTMARAPPATVVRVTPAGQQRTIGRGNLSIGGSANIAIAGQSCSTGRGLIAVTGGIKIAGQSVTVSRGTTVATVRATPSGQSRTTGRGAIALTGGIKISGQSLTSGRGAVVAKPNATPLGRSVTSGRGTPGVSVRVAISGQPMTVARGAVSASAFSGYDIIIIPGQSNSTDRGLGPYTSQSTAKDPYIFQVGRWGSDNMTLVPITPYLEYWNNFPTGHGNGYSIARLWALNNLAPGRGLIVIPAAQGGTSILQWLDLIVGSGDPLWSDMVARVNFALSQPGNNRIVWWAEHQGEQDMAFASDPLDPSYPLMPNAATYLARKLDLIDRVRSTFGVFPMTFGLYSPEWSPVGGATMKAQFEAAVRAASAQRPLCRAISTFDLLSNHDIDGSESNIHFSAAAQETLATRHYGALISMLSDPSRQYVMGGVVGSVVNERGARQYVAPNGVVNEETPSVVYPYGMASSAVRGTPGLAVLVSITGQACSIGRGVPTATARFSPVGRSSTLSRGSPIVSVRVLPAGRSSAVSRGTPSIGIAANYSPSGHPISVLRGTPTASIGATISGLFVTIVRGLVGTTSIPTVITERAHLRGSTGPVMLSGSQMK